MLQIFNESNEQVIFCLFFKGCNFDSSSIIYAIICHRSDFAVSNSCPILSFLRPNLAGGGGGGGGGEGVGVGGPLKPMPIRYS